MTAREKDRRWDGVALISIAAAFIVTGVLYNRLPDPLPTHFDLHGRANGWMPRVYGAWGIPSLALLLWLLLRFIARILPESDRKRLVKGSVSLVAMMTAFFVSAVHVVVLYVAVSPGTSVNRPVFLLMAALFVGLGLVMPRMRRNPIIGVRTKWTLTNDENWARTHRFAGYTMVLGGLIGGLAGAVGGALGGGIAIACFLLSGLVPAAYSLILARRQDQS